MNEYSMCYVPNEDGLDFEISKENSIRVRECCFYHYNIASDVCEFLNSNKDINQIIEEDNVGLIKENIEKDMVIHRLNTIKRENDRKIKVLRKKIYVLNDIFQIKDNNIKITNKNMKIDEYFVDVVKNKGFKFSINDSYGVVGYFYDEFIAYDVCEFLNSNNDIRSMLKDDEDTLIKKSVMKDIKISKLESIIKNNENEIRILEDNIESIIEGGEDG